MKGDNTMKRIFSILLVFIMLVGVAGCSTNTSKAPGGALVGDGGFRGDVMVMGTEMAPEEAPDGEPDVAPGEDVKTEEDAMMEAKPEQPRPGAGTLTAGEWKDANDLEFWTKLLNRNDWYQLMESRNLYANNVIPVYVHDREGNPCYNVIVTLNGAQGTLYTARTGVDGKAWVLRNLNKTDDGAMNITVGNKSFEIPNEGVLDVTVETTGVKVESLDLMLMIDTTGSMSDELSYLQKELENVIERVADAGKTLSINVSVNFYRDETDDYVVKPFEFTSNIQKAISNLNAQSADGGGDYAEAVHKALNNAIKEHQWRNDAVKLMFFVLDAPPHRESEIKGINTQMTETVKVAADKGIRIIPVASSGVDTETEFLLRSWAVMTGGTYTFLTNHSGVGGDHLEPTIGQYKVEKLNDCMTRIICEYCGLEYKAQ